MKILFLACFLLLAACEGPHANVPLELRSKVAEQGFRVEYLRWVDTQSNTHLDRLFTVIAPDSPIEGLELSTLFPPNTRTDADVFCHQIIYAGRFDWYLPPYRVTLQLRALEFNKLTGGKPFEGWSIGDREDGTSHAFFCVRSVPR